MKDIAPVLIGAFPFGTIIGVIGASLGLSASAAIGNSMLIYAGAAQLVFLDLFGQNAPLWVIVLSAGMVNLRMVIYSASLSRYVKHEPFWHRVLMSYLLIDQVFAFGAAHLEKYPDEKHLRHYTYGISILTYPLWAITAVIGFFVGAIIPESWSLTFAIPLMFLAMLVPAIKGRPHLAAAAVATFVALAGVNLPNNLGIVAAILLGMATGVLVERLQ